MKKKLWELTVRFVCHYARNNVSKNQLALIILPFGGAGLLWGYAYPVLKVAIDAPWLQPVLRAAYLHNLKWAIALLPPLVISYFLLYPICRGIQVACPAEFEEELFEESGQN